MTQFAPLPGSIVGMDTEAIRQIALRCEEASEQVNVALGEIAKQAATTQWTGPDARAFAANWTSDVNSQTQQVIAALNQAAQNLRIQAAQQEEASGTGGGGTSGNGGGSQGDGFAGGGGGGGGGGGWGSSDPRTPQAGPCDEGVTPQNIFESMASGVNKFFEDTDMVRRVLDIPGAIDGIGAGIHAWENSAGFAGKIIGDQLKDLGKIVDSITPGSNFFGGLLDHAGLKGVPGLGALNGVDIMKGMGKALGALDMGEHAFNFFNASSDVERWSSGFGVLGEGLKFSAVTYPFGVLASTFSDSILYSSQNDYSAEGFAQVWEYMQKDAWGTTEEIGKAIFGAVDYL